MSLCVISIDYDTSWGTILWIKKSLFPPCLCVTVANIKDLLATYYFTRIASLQKDFDTLGWKDQE